MSPTAAFHSLFWEQQAAAPPFVPGGFPKKVPAPIGFPAMNFYSTLLPAVPPFADEEDENGYED